MWFLRWGYEIFEYEMKVCILIQTEIFFDFHANLMSDQSEIRMAAMELPKFKAINLDLAFSLERHLADMVDRAAVMHAG